jgi:MoaA/NifB/PqqE/SkfB family radical SAM enzyme
MQNLFGPTRAIADAGMAASMLRTALRVRREQRLSLVELGRMLYAQAVLARGFSQHKYVLFRGRVFMDVFSPPWPGRPFDRMNAVYARGDGDFVAYAVLAITRRCVFRCEHCYAAHTLAGRDTLSREKLIELTRALVRTGVGVLSFEGGEPLLRFDDLLALIREARDGACPLIATTGYGLTAEKARALADAGLVCAQISLDHYERDRHNAFRRSERSYDAACRAVGLLRDAGVFPVLAVCATPAMVRGDGLYRYLELARELGAGMIQVLDPMPSGSYLEGVAGEQVLTPEQIEKLKRFHVEANTSPRFRRHPAVTVRAHLEDDCRYGCGMGGNQHFYIDASGNVTPCVYLALSLGNVLEEDFDTIFRRMRRRFPRPMGGFCPVYELAPIVAERARAGEALPLGGASADELLRRAAERGLPGLFARIARGRPVDER